MAESVNNVPSGRTAEVSLMTWSYAPCPDRHPDARRRRTEALEFLEGIGQQKSLLVAVGNESIAVPTGSMS